MKKRTEKQLAKGAYSWLRASPLGTVPSYFFLSALGFDEVFAILGSALWHLMLLKYINNKESDFVRWHGWQAFALAGIRTIVPIAFWFLDDATQSGGDLFGLAIVALIFLWLINTPWGNKQVDDGKCTLAKWMGVTVTPALDIPVTEQNAPAISNQAINTPPLMVEDEGKKPADILKEILNGLQSDDAVNRLSAIARLHSVNYSSEAIRNELERLALNDENEDIRKNALAALDLATQRNIRNHFNKIERRNRTILLAEVTEWQKLGFLEKQTAEVIRRRYDFDLTPPTVPKPFEQTQRGSVPVQSPITPPAQAIPASVAQPVAMQTSAPILPRPQPQPAPAEPRPTLLQTLLSETSIKIALYLGAFFVIASAAILAAVSPILRTPILILATLIFGGLSVAIHKRLPQPSFALFIVFSFLMLITANVMEDALNLSDPFSAGYWVFVSAFMALVWGFGTWLYESRVFSITAFAAFTFALYRIGGMFDAKMEFQASMSGLAALAGLAGTWALKKWKNATFSLPLFLTVQFLQVMVIGAAIILFFIEVINPSTTPLWNLASAFTLGFACIFYVFSDLLFPFLFFPWLAAAALIPIPWFIGMGFDLESLGTMILFAIWGVLISVTGDISHKLEITRKYSLPVLLASIPTFAMAIISGLLHETAIGLVTALGVAFVYGFLHLLRPRGWLWALALFNFTIAYFAFFALDFIEKLNIFSGYPLLILSLIFLLPELFLKADFSADKPWRVPPRIYGALLTAFNFIVFAPLKQMPLINTAVIFLVYAIFFAIYALRYNKAMLGYIAATALAISVFYTFNHFKLDAWLEALSILSVLYFFSGYALRKNEVRAAWRTTLEASGLILGSVTSLVALFALKENSGWFVAVLGALFIVQMYSRKQSLFEFGAHTILSIAIYLILLDFNFVEVTHTLMGISLVILSLDLVFSRTYHDLRVMEWVAKGMGAVLALISSLMLLDGNDLLRNSISFAIYTIFFVTYAISQRKAVYGYIPAAYLALTIFFSLEYYKLDAWLPALTGLAVLYYLAGFIIRDRETQRGVTTSWSEMMRLSGLVLGGILSISAFIVEKEYGGYFIAVSAALFIVEMFVRKNGWLEAGVQILAGMSAFMLVQGFNVTEAAYYVLAVGSTWLTLDMIFVNTFTSLRPLAKVVWALGGILAIVNIVLLLELGIEQPAQTAVCFGIYTLVFLINVVVRPQPTLGYIPAAYLPLTVFYILDFYKLDLWLPALTALAILYFAFGILYGSKKEWGEMLRNSALTLGSLVSLGALFTLKEFSGWYMSITAILFVVEMFVRKKSAFEAGAQIFFSTAIFMILRDFNVTDIAYIALAISLLWLGLDAVLYKTYPAPRLLAWPMRGLGGLLALGNAGYLIFKGMDEPRVAMICFGFYSLFFLVYCLLYQQPVLGYSVTLSFVFTLLYSLRTFGWTEWFLPITAVSAIYYGAGQILQKGERNTSAWNQFTWSFVLWTSGLGIGLITSFIAPLKGGISAAIPSAVTATMVSVEAFKRRNAWLGFPANALYLMSYFILLTELNVDEPQFFSMGAALLGMIQHYLLTRTESKTGAFIMGMLSQLVLLGTTYIQMVSTGELVYFFVLFFQSIVVILYGLVIRSRSLTFTPIGLVVLGVITVLYSTLKGISAVILVGCSGILLLMLGILAVLMRERITKLSEKLSEWKS